MQRPHGYHTKLAEDFSMAIPRASGFASAAMTHTPFAFLSIKLDHCRLSWLYDWFVGRSAPYLNIWCQLTLMVC